MILATDMAHMHEDLEMLNHLIQENDIDNGFNAEHLIDTSSPLTEFKSQQFLLETTVHSGDMSPSSTRKFDTVVKWSYRLFEEYFNQGDVEKAEGLPLYFLGDRHSKTSIPEG